MKSLMEYMSINEDAKKDRIFNVKNDNDKVYMAIRRYFNGVLNVDLADLEKRRWYIPSGRINVPEWQILMKWADMVRDLGFKNPYNNKPMNVTIDTTKNSGMYINVTHYESNEDIAESLAVCYEILFDILDELSSEPAKKRIYYKDLVKEIRKEWVKKYNDLPTPPDEEERKNMRAALASLHGDFRSGRMRDGVYTMGY